MSRTAIHVEQTLIGWDIHAIRGGRVIGFISVYADKEGYFSDDLAESISWLGFQVSSEVYIDGLHVEAPERGSGVGGWLLEEAIFKARREGYDVITLRREIGYKDDDALKRFYERNGFIESPPGSRRMHQILRPWAQLASGPPAERRQGA